MPLLEVHNLSKTYLSGDVATPALCGVSFSIDYGEFVAIIGPSGSGKSTLLHILGFLDTQTLGEYTFDGKPFSKYTAAEVASVRNKKMGFVFQSFFLLSRTTVLENVKLPLLYSSVPRAEWNKRSLAAIESVGLLHRVSHFSSQLSGGEKQRVAIARALVNDPQVIFADEPTGNLDSQSGKIIMEIIQKLSKEQGKAVILITHETSTAEHARRILRMRDGKLESDEPVMNHRNAAEEYRK
jgi:putative ABC transport system ATP-binding protein